ncbi:MAG: alkaline phosphatase family protein [Victivallales bacterium]|nr:alkaline phosphatase family protein [Victivallales bacterium]
MDKSSRGKRKLLLVSCAGLDLCLVQRSKILAKMRFQPLQPVFPAVTCTAQATMRTGLLPAENGILCNGRYDRKECKVTFWSQSAKLMPQPRIWDNLRSRGGRVAVLFHQQSLGDTADIVLSPAPVHKHGGGMAEAFHAKPASLPAELRRMATETFRLRHYWGPLASAEAGAYCAEATAAVMELYAPELVMTYLPDMDYCLQREGPQGKHVELELDLLANHIRYLLDAADELGYESVFWGDYSIVPVSRVVYPNKALLASGLFAVREVNGRQYPNLYEAKAFAMTDHQVTHVFVNDKALIPQVQELLASLPGVAAALTPEEAGLSHTNCGELVLLAEADSWFAYKWWDDDRTAPDYANHVDIHSKIGYDPCELFWKIPFFSTATDCNLVRGSHGRADAPAAFYASQGIDLLYNANTLPELAAMIKDEVIG